MNHAKAANQTLRKKLLVDVLLPMLQTGFPGFLALAVVAAGAARET
jgi:hypothetical protein